MGLIAKQSGGARVLCPSGTYPARCVSVIDMGTQYNESFSKWQHEVRLTWELPTERHVFNEDKGEEPFLLSRKFTLSLHPKSTLSGFLVAWRGKAFSEAELQGFDVSKLLGAPCMLNVVHSDNGEYANVQGASTLPKGLDCPEASTAKVLYLVEDGQNEVFMRLPDFIKEIISKSQEWQNESSTAAPAAGGSADPDEDDVPF